MQINVKQLFDLHIFLFFLVFNHDFIIIFIDFTRIAASNTELMTSQIRSHVEYLLQTFSILVGLLILYSNLMKNLASLHWWFLLQFNDDS